MRLHSSIADVESLWPSLFPDLRRLSTSFIADIETACQGSSCRFATESGLGELDVERGVYMSTCTMRKDG